MPVEDSQAIYDFPMQRWAEPRVSEAAAWMRALRDDRGLAARIGAKAVETAASIFGFEVYRRHLHQAFAAACMKGGDAGWQQTAN